MKAIQLNKPGGLDKLIAVDVEPREPGPGEIRIAVEEYQREQERVTSQREETDL